MCGYAWRYLPFSTSPQNPWLANFIPRAHLTIFWECCNFEDIQSQTPSPQLAVLWHGHVGTEGQQYLKANLMCHSKLSTEDAGRGDTIFCYCHICIYPGSVRVFVFRLITALLQGVNPHAQTCVAYGRFSYFIFGEQPAQRGRLQIEPSWH